MFSPVPPSPAKSFFATVLDVPSPASCPAAPPPTPRTMPIPDDVQDGVFRDLPRIDEIDELVLHGPQRSPTEIDDVARNNGGPIYEGAPRSPQYVNALADQGTPSSLPSAVRLRVKTGGVTADPHPYYAPHYDFNGGVAGGDPLTHSPSTPIVYPQPVYGVLRPEGVSRVLGYHALGTYANSGDEAIVEPEGELTRDGLHTVLPLPPRGGAGTPSTPGNAFAGMSINGRSGQSSSDAAPGLNVLSETASFLANTQARYDIDSEMRFEGAEVTPTRTGSPANLNRLNDVHGHHDRPVPGYDMNAEEFARQQRELVGYQIAHDEARASPSVLRLPTAQFYSRATPRSPIIDPVLLRGYAPMEVDGFPLPRMPLAHARADGSVSSDNDLYAPAPLEVNRPDDPADAPRVAHLYNGAEIPGPVMRNGEARYSHDVPVRNSAAISAAVQGASRDIPQIWHAPDHVEDARHLAGGNAAPPQHVLLPAAVPVTFTTIPPGGPPPIHFDDPEFLIKGLAAERVQVIYRQPQSTAGLARIFNGGVPRASNVKLQSDALAESITAASGATNFILVPPAQAYGQELSLQDQPATWIILRLTPDQLGMLVRQRVWSSKKITFLAFNRDLKFDRFIGRIGYYTHNFDNDIDTSIRRVFAGPLILPSIKALVADHPHILADDIDPTVERILASIRVDVVTYPNGNIVANVYCDSPTPVVEAWRTWTTYVHTVPFWSDLNPTGQFLRPIRCAGCSGADHPTFLCPLALLQSWNGPTPGAATIEGPATTVLPGAPFNARGGAPRGSHPYRGGSARGRRGRGRAAPF